MAICHLAGGSGWDYFYAGICDLSLHSCSQWCSGGYMQTYEVYQPIFLTIYSIPIYQQKSHQNIQEGLPAFSSVTYQSTQQYTHLFNYYYTTGFSHNLVKWETGDFTLQLYFSHQLLACLQKVDLSLFQKVNVVIIQI